MALDVYEGLRAKAAAIAAERALNFAALCHADGLVRRLRDQLWGGVAPDGVAEIVGAFSERH